MTLVISKDGRETKVVPETSIEKESYLQEYIKNNPEIIPVSDIKEDLKIIPVKREFPTDNNERIDVLAIDGEGSIYVIEAKLESNTDKRKAIAQVIDYGASLIRQYNPDSFVKIIIENLKEKHQKDSINEILQEEFPESDVDEESFLENLRKNFSDGEFVFLIVMDHLDDRLKDMISFLKDKSRLQLYAVETEFYEHDGYEIVVPHLFGAEEPSVKRTNEVFSVEDHLKKGSIEIQKLYKKLESEISKFGRSDINPVKHYIGFIKNNQFAYIKIRKQFLRIVIVSHKELDDPKQLAKAYHNPKYPQRRIVEMYDEKNFDYIVGLIKQAYVNN
ncbi:MAG: hypothetical protein GWN01_13560 [Nitrosopumilaceae archaeon]|nr:hypothetical protein [Nitrosopumilaceae archaeon]NIU01891.1 hypothetical protein [Nitrosopumilaceae archaeon]NIU88295.1 hypothetical protein [Nitrosopumilaceae archaeon]NIV66587.1 hypothetical protein [Nitrosopumilaceae archaeon]NIX62492.1 hypothetical protein [Nitrosopumilaceae archaeon]